MPPRLLNLPPLELFRGFVAVARSLNVTAAARELAITQPALAGKSTRSRTRWDARCSSGGTAASS